MNEEALKTRLKFIAKEKNIMKDYHDLLLMLRELDTLFNRGKLITSIKGTFSQRNTNLKFPIAQCWLDLSPSRSIYCVHLFYAFEGRHKYA